MIAALFVETDGCYFRLPDVDPWDVTRDARTYAGPYPVVAHPPCARWGRYWSGGPSARVRRELGDDGGCFAAAIAAVRKFGGVLEHPEASHAFKKFHLGTYPYSPPHEGGWISSTSEIAAGLAQHPSWSCCVEQGHYGHPARKKTWLYCISPTKPPELTWGPSQGVRLDEGFHSKAERDAARAAGIPPRKRLSTAQNLATPIAFRDVLLGIARSAIARRAA